MTGAELRQRLDEHLSTAVRQLRIKGYAIGPGNKTRIEKVDGSFVQTRGTCHTLDTIRKIAEAPGKGAGRGARPARAPQGRSGTAEPRAE